MISEINIIRKIVWSYVRSTGLEFEDLFSEACVAYLEAADRYDPSKGRKSTFIWRVVQNSLNNLLRDQNRRQREIPTDREEMETMIDGGREELNPEQTILAQERWQELLSGFSPEAQAVCSIVTDGLVSFPVEKPRNSRGIIARELRDRGWSHGMVWGTFSEIKEALM